VCACNPVDTVDRKLKNMGFFGKISQLGKNGVRM
jgi:hypothetical protein